MGAGGLNPGRLGFLVSYSPITDLMCCASGERVYFNVRAFATVLEFLLVFLTLGSRAHHVDSRDLWNTRGRYGCEATATARPYPPRPLGLLSSLRYLLARVGLDPEALNTGRY